METGSTIAPRVLGEQFVDEEVAPRRHRRRRRVLAGVPPPDEHLVHFLALPGRLVERFVGLHLVVGELARPEVAVHGDQDPAAGVSDPGAAGVAAETAEDLRVNDAEPGAGEHRDGKLGDHRHVQGHTIARLQPGEVPQDRGELVHLAVQLAVADHDVLVRLELGHPDDRGLVGARLGVPVDAVVRRIQLAADEPVPERRIRRIKRRVPSFIPGEKIGVLGEALREFVLGKPVEDGGIGGIGLGRRTAAAAGSSPLPASALRSGIRRPGFPGFPSFARPPAGSGFRITAHAVHVKQTWPHDLSATKSYRRDTRFDRPVSAPILACRHDRGPDQVDIAAREGIFVPVMCPAAGKEAGAAGNEAREAGRVTGRRDVVGPGRGPDIQ